MRAVFLTIFWLFLIPPNSLAQSYENVLYQVAVCAEIEGRFKLGGDDYVDLALAPNPACGPGEECPNSQDLLCNYGSGFMASPDGYVATCEHVAGFFSLLEKFHSQRLFQGDKYEIKKITLKYRLKNQQHGAFEGQVLFDFAEAVTIKNFLSQRVPPALLASGKAYSIFEHYRDDIMFIKIPDGAYSYLDLRKSDLKKDEPVTSIAYDYFNRRPISRQGSVIFEILAPGPGGHFFPPVLNLAAFPGNSGGAVIDQNGQAAAMIASICPAQESEENTTGAVPSSLMRKYLKIAQKNFHSLGAGNTQTKTKSSN